MYGVFFIYFLNVTERKVNVTSVKSLIKYWLHHKKIHI